MNNLVLMKSNNHQEASHDMIIKHNHTFVSFTTIMEQIQLHIYTKKKTNILLISFSAQELQITFITLGYKQDVNRDIPFVAVYNDTPNTPYIFNKNLDTGLFEFDLIAALKNIPFVLPIQAEMEFTNILISISQPTFYMNNTNHTISDNVIYAIGQENIAARLCRNQFLFWKQYATCNINVSNLVLHLTKLTQKIMQPENINVAIIDNKELHSIFRHVSGLGVSNNAIADLIYTKHSFEVIGKTDSSYFGGAWLWQANSFTSSISKTFLDTVDQNISLLYETTPVKTLNVAEVLLLCEQGRLTDHTWIGSQPIYKFITDLQIAYNENSFWTQKHKTFWVSFSIQNNGNTLSVIRRLYEVHNGKLYACKGYEFNIITAADLKTRKNPFYGFYSHIYKQIVVCIISYETMPHTNMDIHKKELFLRLPVVKLKSEVVDEFHHFEIDLYNVAVLMNPYGYILVGDVKLFDVVDNIMTCKSIDIQK